jgi:4-hydroxyphenylpyruvate dioxygenase-like putative hemolysin
LRIFSPASDHLLQFIRRRGDDGFGEGSFCARIQIEEGQIPAMLTKSAA